MDYSNKTRNQLIQICKDRGIKGYSGKKVKQLIELIKKNETTPVSESIIESNTYVKNEQVKNVDMTTVINKLFDYVSTNNDKRIILLKNKEVIMWLFGDLSFLPPIEKKNKTADIKKLKDIEDSWGRSILKIRRPDLKLDKQWTNKFGEHLCEEIYILLGKKVSKPVKKENYEPDLEIVEEILEVKTETYYTEGTASEKILGCPFKYAEIPELYSKPLKIICMGGAEKICREKYGNLPGVKCSITKKRFLDFFKENRIEFISATDILKGLISL
jgi:hypothetical protein